MGGSVGVGMVGRWVSGEGGGKLVFGDLVPAAVGDSLLVVVCSGFLEGEVDAAVVGPVEFGGVTDGDVAAGGENGVERVSGGVGGCRDELFEAEVGEVVQ